MIKCDAIEILGSYPLDSLLSAMHVAKGGNPNVTLRSDFVRVVFVDPLEVQEENTTADNITSHHSGVNREALQLNNEQTQFFNITIF